MVATSAVVRGAGAVQIVQLVVVNGVKDGDTFSDEFRLFIIDSLHQLFFRR